MLHMAAMCCLLHSLLLLHKDSSHRHSMLPADSDTVPPANVCIHNNSMRYCLSIG